ncbi:ABC transporter substrate-binding protein [Lichenihabitans psoromatis]|uniref:ABC transporter substrate-binding protein n=1 Tax=Lichenihabitans psoromatis TaxID=2528642 RepID=UPI0010364402
MYRNLLIALALLIGVGWSTGSARADDKLTVILDWFVNPDHAAIVIAKEGGYFKKAGLDVTLIEPADPATPPRLVAAGQGDIAVTYQPTFYLEVKDGMNLQRVGAAIETPLNTLIALESGPIKTLADLKGKTIGYSIAGYEQALLETLLKTAGLTLKDVKLVDVNFALTQALVSGQVDAVIGGYRNFELTEMKLAGHPGRVFDPEDYGFPPYDELIYVTTPEKAKSPAVRAFLDATEQATLYILNHPDDAWAMFIKAYPKLDDDLNRQAWKDTVPRLAASPAAVDPERYIRFAEFLKAKGLIDKVEPVERYIGAR